MKKLFLALSLLLLSTGFSHAANFYAVTTQIVTLSSTGNVISLAGNGTSWSGTPFSVSGGSGASITAQSVSNSTTASITLSAGSATGALTISDGTNTTSIYVESPIWSSVVNDNFNRANTSVGAAGTTTGAGNSWTDNHGGTYSILSNALNGAPDVATDYTTNFLNRPSGENQTDERTVINFTYPSGFVTNEAYLAWTRLSGSAGTITGYIADFSSASFSLFEVVNASIGALGSSFSYTPTIGDAYKIDFSTWGTSPTTYLAILTDTTTCAIITVITGTDSTSGLQTSNKYAIGSQAGSSTPAALTFTNAATYSNTTTATAYTLSGPSSGTVNNASTNFTVTPIGTSTVTITPHTSGSGSFTPSTVTFSGSGSKTFTYTPTSTSGSPHTISVTNSSSLTDPSSLSYTVSASGSVSVTDANVFFSPLNWYSDGAGGLQANNIKSSSTYALTQAPGAYIKTGFSGTAIAISVDVSALTGASEPGGSWPILQYSIDDGALQTHQLASSDTSISLASGLSSGNHTLFLIFDATSEQYDAWNTPVDALKVTGFTIDSGSSSVAPTLRTNRIVIYGDSITAGVRIISTSYPTGNDANQAYTFGLATAFNAEVGVLGYGAQGYGQGGVGNVPQFSSAYNYYYSGAARSYTNQPDDVFVVMGTNGSTGQSDVATMITNLRAVYPSANMFFCVPPGGFARTPTLAAVAASGDAKVFSVDLGTIFQTGLNVFPTVTLEAIDGLHPRNFIHGRMSAGYAQGAQSNLTGGGGSSCTTSSLNNICINCT